MPPTTPDVRASAQSAPQWLAGQYAENGRFISELGIELLDWLRPAAGERILDAGCGDGYVTERIAASGARTLGIDASPDMVAATRARGLDADVHDLTALPFDGEFDAVFSNSVFQWIPNPAAAAAGISRALKPGGRFVCDVAALGNLAAVLTAMTAVSDANDGDAALANPFYSPSAAGFGDLLAHHGLTVERIELQPRFTPMQSDLWGWIETIFTPFVEQFGPDRRVDIRRQVLELLAPVLRDEAGNWYADHVRLRVRAIRTG